MKNPIIYVVLLLILRHTVYSQCQNQLNTVTTDWRHYPGNGGNNLSKNNWNWTLNYPNFSVAYITSNKDAVSQKIIPVPITSPFYSPQNSTGSNQNLAHFQSLSPEQKDFWPEDGWELLVKNFGECPNPPDCYEATATNNPFFALYNRLTGTVRAFMLITQGPSDKKMTGAMISMKFMDIGVKRALFAQAEPATRTVQDFDPGLMQSSPNRYINENNYWIYADFSMAYDPCTCFNPGLSSLIQFQYSLLFESAIQLTGDGKINETVMENVPGGTSPASNGYTGIFGTDVDPASAVKQGLKAYKTWDGYKNEANKFLTNQNAIYKAKLEKEYFDSHPNMVVNNKPINTLEELKALDNGTKSLMGIDNDPNYELLKGVASTLPYVGTAIGIIDMFVAGGTKKQETQASRAPMSFEVQLGFKGTITSDNPVGDRYFYTPGSNTSAIQWIPDYNNTLGVFNLLETPGLKHYTYDPKIVGFSDPDRYWTPWIRQFRQFKLRDNLKYVVNPASNLEVVSIDAAYVLEFDGKFNREFTHSSNYFHWNNYMVEMGVYGDVPFEERVKKAGLEIDYLSEGYPASGYLRLRTAYVPLTNFHLQNFALLYIPNPGTAVTGYSPVVYIKLYIKLKRTDVAGAEPVTVIRTFKMEDNAIRNSEEINPVPGNVLIYQRFTANNPYSWVRFPAKFESFPRAANAEFTNENVYLTDTVVTRSIHAKGTILVDDHVVFPTEIPHPEYDSETGQLIYNYHVDLLAAKSIEIKDVNILAPGVSLEIGTLASKDFSPVGNYLATDAEIHSVCNSAAYMNQTNARYAMTTDEVEYFIANSDHTSAPEDAISIRLSPNPVSSLGTFTFDIHESTNVKLYIVNIQGEVVRELMKKTNYPAGTFAISENLSDLNSGMYYYVMETDTYKKSDKLVIIK